MVAEFTMHHRITYYECDETGHPTLATAIAMLILASDNENTATGVGQAASAAYGGGWVIVNYAGKLGEQQAKVDEEVVLRTRVRAYNRFFVVRDFWIESLSGTVYMQVTGMFVFMSLTKRKLIAIPQSMIDGFSLAPTKRLPRLEKPAEVTEWQGAFSREYRVRYFDIDSNRHVNNAHYFDWMEDPLGADFLKAHRVRKFRLAFDHEVRYGQTVTSTCMVDETTTGIVTHHLIRVGEHECARATIDWQEN